MTLIRSANELQQAARAELAATLFSTTPLVLNRAFAEQLIAGRSGWFAHLDAGDVRVDSAWEPSLPTMDELEVTPEGVAVVRIGGMLVRRSRGLHWYRGFVSYDGIAELFDALARESRVRGVVAIWDSPGGDYMGVGECAAAVAESIKNLPAYCAVEGQMNSGGYWIGCGFDRIYATPSSALGSIGAYVIRVDVTKLDQEMGVAYTFVESDERKTDGNPHKEPSKGEIDDTQRWVDTAAGLFREYVAGNRPLTVDQVRGLKGAIFMGADAVEAKLADKVGAARDAVAAITKKITDARSASFGTPARTEGGAMDPKTEGKDKADEKAAAIFGDPVVRQRLAAERQAGVDAGKAEAHAAAEEIATLCLHYGQPDRAAEFIKAGKTRAEAFAILQADVVKKAADTQTSGANAGGDPAPKGAELEPAEAVHDRHRKQAMAHRFGREVA